MSIRQQEAEHAKLLERLCTPGTTPPELDKIADVCLNYRPKSRAKKAKRRKKRKTKKNV